MPARILALWVAALCLLATHKALAADVTILAAPESRVAPKDVFEIDKLIWKCDGAICATVAPPKMIEAASCHALAQKIGRIGYFGDQDKKQTLPPLELEYCNKGIAASGPSQSSPQGAGGLPRPLPPPVDPSRIRSGTFLAELAAASATPLRKPTVAAAGMSWRCVGERCTTSTLRGYLTVASCQALAQRVGALRYYGLEDRSAFLSKIELHDCNEGVLALGTGRQEPVPSGLASPPPQAGPIRERPPTPELQEQIEHRRAIYDALARELAEQIARADAAERERERQRREREEAMRQAELADDSYNTAGGDDCDDNDPHTHPGALETCDLKDNNCDGRVDEDLTTRAYLDADGDAHGDPATETFLCPFQLGGTGKPGTELWVNVGNDCDDTDPDRWRRDPNDPTRCFGPAFGESSSPLPQ